MMNVTISVKDTDTAGIFMSAPGGAMQIAILVEQMRRRLQEVLVPPMVVIIEGTNDGPFETALRGRSGLPRWRDEGDLPSAKARSRT